MRKSSYTGKYRMSKIEYRCAYYYALRYHCAKQEYQALQLQSDIDNTRVIKLKHIIDIIEQTAKESDENLSAYILEAVTNEDVTFKRLEVTLNIPCSRNTYYDRRRRFYWLLSQKI